MKAPIHFRVFAAFCLLFPAFFLPAVLPAQDNALYFTKSKKYDFSKVETNISNTSLLNIKT